MEASLTDFRRACTGATRTLSSGFVAYSKEGSLVAYMKWDAGRWIRHVVHGN